MDRVSAGMMILASAFALWLVVHPRSLVDLCTARRMPASEWDIFFARLAGGVLIWLTVFLVIHRMSSVAARFTLVALWEVIGICGVVFLGYELASRRMSRRDQRVLSEEPALPTSETETPEETRARYRAAWRKYRRLRFEFPLLIPGWFAFGALLGGIFRLFRWNQHIAMVFIVAYVPFMSVVGWQWSFWQCPRCRKAFKGKYPFYPKRCYYCGLPKWAESADE
jgi:hypothetical protein